VLVYVVIYYARRETNFDRMTGNNVSFGYGPLNAVKNEPRSSVLPYTQKSATSKENFFPF
jgi:hypothetical protein